MPVAAPSPRACSPSRWNRGGCSCQSPSVRHPEPRRTSRQSHRPGKRQLARHLQSHQVPTAPRLSLEAPAPLGHSANLEPEVGDESHLTMSVLQRNWLRRWENAWGTTAMALSSPKELHGTRVKPCKRDMLRLSMKLVFHEMIEDNDDRKI